MENLLQNLNSRLPFLLQCIRTASIAAIAVSAICGSKSLKQLTTNQEAATRALLMHLHKGHGHSHEAKTSSKKRVVIVGELEGKRRKVPPHRNW